MIIRKAVAIGFGASVLALATAWVAAPLYRSVDLRVYDAVLRLAPVGDGTLPGVAVVAIDNASIRDIGRWPWPRSEIARLVDTLSSLGASVVAFDFLLSEVDDRAAQTADVASERAAGSASPRLSVPVGNDAKLASALARGRTVLAHAFTFGGTDRSNDASCEWDPLPIVLVHAATEPSPESSLFHPQGAVCSLSPLARAAGSAGFLNAGADPDGVLRRVPMLVRSDAGLHPSLALAAVLRAQGDPPLTLRRTSGGDLELGIGDRVVHLDDQGTKLVPFRGPSEAVPELSAASALQGRIPPGALKDRVVFVGATALGLGDVVATPLDLTFPGVDLHATMAAALIDGRFVDTPSSSRAWAVLLVLLAGPILALLVAWRGLWVGGAALALSVVGFFLASVVAMSARSIYVSPVLPSLGVALALTTLLFVRARLERAAAVEERRRRDQTQRFALQSLTALVEIRDHATGMHARRTASYASLLATTLRSSPRFRDFLTDEVLAVITQLAPLHDIGKVGISDAVLHKPGPLTEDEFAEMRTHPELGYRTIMRAEHDSGIDSELEDSVLRLAKDLVRSHHERWDGKGYPRSLAGDEIPIPARIMALVDVYDALVQSRVYRPAMTHAEARALVVAGRGTSFDPDVVDAFLSVESEFEALTVRYHDELSAT